MWKNGAVSATLRSPGVLNEPSTPPIGAAGACAFSAAIDSGAPNGSVPPLPGSLADGRTPMLKKPVSCRPRWLALTAPSRATSATVAVVSAAPAWHSMQSPAPAKTFMPCRASALSAEASPARKRSTGVWSETRVDS